MVKRDFGSTVVTYAVLTDPVTMRFGNWFGSRGRSGFVDHYRALQVIPAIN
jgi:hypothetical protein